MIYILLRRCHPTQKLFTPSFLETSVSLTNIQRQKLSRLYAILGYIFLAAGMAADSKKTKVIKELLKMLMMLQKMLKFTLACFIPQMLHKKLC